MAKVSYYENSDGVRPVQEYLNELAKRAQNEKLFRGRLKKVQAAIFNLEQIGYRYVLSSARHIEGVDNLWELRPGTDRVLFFLVLQNEYVLLHAFEKKSQKTPRMEIERAKREITDFLKRRNNKNA
ncbi:MAG: type II toxin-antitoxin system RelE/ParE family toxin [Pyramidobacter sp.]|nr:type II toxin-antitoxin system RelE/ParE family toxin [Pyramidobacter sp.]